MFAPASIRILSGDQPVGSQRHGFAIGVSEFCHPCSQTHQNLTSVKSYRHGRRITHRTALKRAAEHLDAHEPIQHLSGTLQQHDIARQSRLADDRGNDITGGFWVGSAPTRDQTILTGHSAIRRTGMILRAANPGQRSRNVFVNRGFRAGSLLPFPADFALGSD